MKMTIHAFLCALLICLAVGYTPTRGMGQQAQPATPPAAPMGAMGQPGRMASYRRKDAVVMPGSTVRTFTMALGEVDKSGDRQWMCLSATKANGERFRIFLLSAGYPPASLEAARPVVRRYLLQEGSSPAREYRNVLTGEAVLPALGGWQYLLPRAAGQTRAGAEPFPEQVSYLGQRYVRESLTQSAPVNPPADARVIVLRPDLLMGPESNSRQKDETRRYDSSEYEYVRLTRDDYRLMAQAGINCVQVNAEQAPWAEDLGLYYWGGGGGVLKYPESLYRSQYLGPTLFLDEPAVGTRDYVLTPRLHKDPAFRQSITPQAAFEAFRGHYAEALKGAPFELRRELVAQTGDDLDFGITMGNMYFAQQNLFSWETMAANAAYELSQDPRVPEAFVYEPPGRIGSHRTLPEMDMTYGVQIRPDDPEAFTDIIFGFLRGAARATHKSWGVSIYGQVQREDSPWWLTHAYDMGATRFFFWDNAALATVPFGEVLALARHLRTYADMHPRPDLTGLSRSAEVAILLPPGYNLGHVYTGRGPLWGLPELNLERTNREGVKYRTVMSHFFVEIERCIKLGVDFDLLCDLPGLEPQGYRETVRIREDGKVEVLTEGKRTVLPGPRIPPRAPGVPPGLTVTVSGAAAGDGVEVSALAEAVEKSAPVYYTFGAASDGVEYNEMVAWELYGPQAEDHQFLAPVDRAHAVTPTSSGAEMRVRFKLTHPGSYRLRAATVDTAGRSTVVWKSLVVTGAGPGAELRLREE
jgi:hypothetical protein